MYIDIIITSSSYNNVYVYNYHYKIIHYMNIWKMLNENNFLFNFMCQGRNYIIYSPIASIFMK